MTKTTSGVASRSLSNKLSDKRRMSSSSRFFSTTELRTFERTACLLVSGVNWDLLDTPMHSSK